MAGVIGVSPVGRASNLPIRGTCLTAQYRVHHPRDHPLPLLEHVPVGVRGQGDGAVPEQVRDVLQCDAFGLPSTLVEPAQPWRRGQSPITACRRPAPRPKTPARMPSIPRGIPIHVGEARATRKVDGSGRTNRRLGQRSPGIERDIRTPSRGRRDEDREQAEEDRHPEEPPDQSIGSWCGSA